MRLSGHAHRIVTKTVHKTLPGGGGGQGLWGSGVVRVMGVRGGRGQGVGGGGGQGWWGSGVLGVRGGGARG